jgi:uncharacterized protein YjdB
MHIKRWFITLILTLLFISGCSDHDDSPPPVVLTDIQLTMEQTEFPVGISQQATATGNYSDNTTQAGTYSYTWSSDNSGIAEVNTNGTVKGVSVGTTKINAEHEGIKSFIEVTVTDAIPLSIQIFPGVTSITAGMDVTYTATARYSNNQDYELTNNDGSTWESSDESVASFEGTEGLDNIARTLTKGSTEIDVLFEGVRATTPAILNVTEATLVKLVITPTNTNKVPNGQSIDFTAEAYYSDDTHTDITSLGSWVSFDEDKIIASSTAGTFDALAIGEGTVEISYMSIRATAEVFVITPEFESLQVNSPEEQYIEGTTTPFTATAIFAGEVDDFDLTKQKNGHWQSSNTAVATVDDEGVVTALIPGDTKITFAFLTEVAEQSITVVNSTLASIDINPNNAYYLGETSSLQLTATGHYTNGDAADVTYNRSLIWYVVNDEGIVNSLEGQVSLSGEVTNYRTDTPLSIEFTVEASLDGIKARRTINFAATDMLKSEDQLLTFTAPITDVEAETIGLTKYVDDVYTENGISGLDGSAFILADYFHAESFCLHLNGGVGFRLPTYLELQEIWKKYDGTSDGDYALYKENKWAVGKYFWTSDSHPDGEQRVVDLQTGVEDLSASFNLTQQYVSCVR